MELTLTCTRSHEYVRYAVEGQASLKNFAALLLVVAEDLGQYEDSYVLLDLRAVQGRLTSAEQALLGEMGATRLPFLAKLASLVPPQEITRNSERKAREKGLRVRVFVSETEAIAWLTKPRSRAADTTI
jgi:hypothetical protein